jgi:hypothetical protein
VAWVEWDLVRLEGEGLVVNRKTRFVEALDIGKYFILSLLPLSATAAAAAFPPHPPTLDIIHGVIFLRLRLFSSLFIFWHLKRILGAGCE